MELNEIAFTEAQPIDSYGPGFFRVGGKVLTGPVAVSAAGARGWAGFDEVQPLTELGIDVLLVGTGAEISHVPQGFRNTLERAGIGVEQMASPAACRTYNILASEGRRVAAVLMPV